jgi:hypothetical protein
VLPHDLNACILWYIDIFVYFEAGMRNNRLCYNILQYIVTDILYWLLQQYQYIVLVVTCIAIYCIGGNEYCNIFIVRIRNHRYNNNTIVRIPVSKCYTPQSVALLVNEKMYDILRSTPFKAYNWMILYSVPGSMIGHHENPGLYST